ncbi:PilW family protein [Vibrio aphrogenes]|uniref:PilW family protein n=1 Tax=Vibrio aphrogenes TaxID=1891186 RepID=UPI000B34D353|nr:prepilin-type N-terminal cleavage/methylation domain-containing protein [Vibrio aphrogenes]
MVFRPVSNLRSRQLGVSLIEMLVASTISIVVMIAVGSIFLSGQQLATERMQRLLVIQGINEALRYIKEDAQRAGFNGSEGASLMLSGAFNVISTSHSSLAYTYKKPDGDYTQVTFLLDDAKLKLCVNTEVVPIVNACTPALSLLDQHRLRVDSFVVSETPLGGSVSSALINLSLTASLNDGTHTQTLSTQIKQRNWN